MQRDADAALLQCTAGRSGRGVSSPDPIGSGCAQRDGDDQPGTCRPGRPEDPRGRRQRNRRGRGRGGCDHARGTHQHQRGIRRLRRHLYRQREQAPLPERERDCADGRDARALQRARLFLEPQQLRVRVGHARRHSFGHRSGRSLGLGRDGNEIRQAVLQGEPAAGDRLCRERSSHPGTCRQFQGA